MGIGHRVAFRAFFFCGIFFLVSASWAWSWQGKVVRVLDGDSLLVKRGRSVVEVRLYGIDAPEYGQGNWGAARRRVEELVTGGYVHLEQVDRDRYGRVVALLTSRGVLVNRELIRDGFAWVYPRYCTSQPLCTELDGLEAEARKAARGLWRKGRPVSPWTWKEMKRRNGSKSRSGK